MSHTVAIRNVQKVGASGDRAQRIPRLDVGARVVDVAVGAAEGDGDVAVGSHGQDEQQLLEIGPVGLRMPEDDGGRAAPANGSPRGGSIAAEEADRRAVVVKLVETQIEALSDRQDDLGQCSAVGVEESVQGASEPVVAEVLHRLGVDAKHAAGKAVNGFLLAVDGLALDDE
jgi:hypothetical protein